MTTNICLWEIHLWYYRRRKWQPTPVFLPGESQGQRSLVGCRLWGHTVRHNWSNLAAAAVNPKGHQPWIFIGRTHAEAEAPIFWPRDVKSWLIGKDPDADKYWGQEEKRVTEDEMAEWHHDSMDMNLSKLQEIVRDSEAWCAPVHSVAKSQIWTSDWTTTILVLATQNSVWF